MKDESQNNVGPSVGGRPPFGFKLEGERLVPNPLTAPVRRRIYELFVEHKRQLVVARILNERGYRTATGKKFSRQTVERNIRDTTAKGIHRTNYSAIKDGRIILKPESEWISQEVTPIVSTELWEEANAILQTQRAHRTNIGRRATHLFSGFAFCECGSKMYVPTRNARYVCQKCDNRIPTTDLEDIYQKQLDSYLSKHWKTFSPAHKREVVETLTKRIIVNTASVHIESYPLPDMSAYSSRNLGKKWHVCGGISTYF